MGTPSAILIPAQEVTKPRRGVKVHPCAHQSQHQITDHSYRVQGLWRINEDPNCFTWTGRWGGRVNFHPPHGDPGRFLTWWGKYWCESGASTAWACPARFSRWSESHRPPPRAGPEWFEPVHPEKGKDRVSTKKKKQPRGCLNSTEWRATSTQQYLHTAPSHLVLSTKIKSFSTILNRE